MVGYINNESDMLNKAYLVSSVGSELREILPDSKKCEYGRFFQHIYSLNKNITASDKKILWSGLALLGTYSVHEDIKPSLICRKARKF